MSLRTRIRDWWRGYSDADVRSVRAKLSGYYQPGAIVWLEHGEMRAMQRLGIMFPQGAGR